MQNLLASTTVSVSELKKNPSAVLAESGGEPVAVLNHNKVMGYMVPAELFESILERLEEDKSHFAILEANGGSTVWGRKGILSLANTIVNLEEGARLQAIAETLGGSKTYGPGVLEQQWKMSGLWTAEDEVNIAAQ